MKNDILITPGTFFDGYVATQYFSPISYESVTQLPPIAIGARSKFGNVLEEKISASKEEALTNLMQKAKSLGANAIIGYSCNYLSFNPGSNSVMRGDNYQTICIIVEGIPVVLRKE